MEITGLLQISRYPGTGHFNPGKSVSNRRYLPAKPTFLTFWPVRSRDFALTLDGISGVGRDHLAHRDTADPPAIFSKSGILGSGGDYR
jgi:hypothetical protein